jgi:putative membrane protein
MKRTGVVLLSSLLCICASSVHAQAMGSGTRETPADSPDAMFVQQASVSGTAEVELSRIAVRQAQSPQVRRFAQDMLQEHERNNRELMTIAAHENIAAPPNLIDDAHAQLRAQLSVMHGGDFDRAYMDAMREDHEKLAVLLRSSQATVSTPELRRYIATTLPVVQDHLQMAESVHLE